MDSDKRLPPDVPRDWDEAKGEVNEAVSGVAAKASELTDKAVSSVKDGYERAKQTVSEFDPREAARDAGRYVKETGGAAVEQAERHPLLAFGLGAASVGLVAWAVMRGRRDSWEPDYGPVRRLFHDYGGRDLVKSGEKWLRNGSDYLRGSGGYLRGGSDHAAEYGDQVRDYLRSGGDYAREGGRMLAGSTQREPLAALLGVGIALYLVGSFLTASSSSSESKRDGRR